MTTSRELRSTAAEQNVDAIRPCWREIGVQGDGTCDQLKRVVHCHNCEVLSEAGQRLFERPPTDDDVAGQTSQLAEVLEQELSGLEALIVFRMGEEWLALDVSAVVEVAEPRTIHRIPYRSNRILLGLINVRGELQLCVSLRALLGLEEHDSASAADAQRLLICERDGERWAFAVDEVAAVQRVGVEQLTNVPSTVSRGSRRLTKSVFAWNEHHVGRLDEQRLFECLEKSIR